MTIKIYGMAMSTCTGRVLATLFEKDVTDFELVPVNVLTGEQKKPEYLKLQLRELNVENSMSLSGTGEGCDVSDIDRLTFGMDDIRIPAHVNPDGLTFGMDDLRLPIVKGVLIDERLGDESHPMGKPFGQIPVLQDGPLTIFESRAIARTIAHKYESQGTKLYGSTPMDKALVENWLEVESQNYHPAISTIVAEFFKVMRGGQADQAVVDPSIEKLEKVLDVYEERLSNTKYLAGDFFSLADLSHLPYTQYLVTFKRDDIISSDKRPHVKAWWADISSRPAWKKVTDLTAASKQYTDLLKTM